MVSLKKKTTTKDYFASMKGGKLDSKSKFQLKLTIDSHLSHLF